MLELIKTDSSGNQLWLQTYPGFPGNVLAEQTNDDGFVLAGTTTDNPSKFFFAKIDSSGTVVWNTTYSDSRIDSRWRLFLAFPNKLVSSQHKQYASADIVFKTDVNGDQHWNQTYSKLYSNAIQTDNESYVLGQSSSGTIILSQIDGLGIIHWTGSYSVTAESSARFVVATPDGGFALTGNPKIEQY